MLGGTGEKLTEATKIVAGVGSLTATLMSIVSIWLQLKNYRKPLLQRYVVRILLMVPIYSVASFASIISATAAQCLDPIRDIYEAFTIYTFFQLLINYLDGERALIIMTHGREPVHHMWPMTHVLPPVDISDPQSFLALKRGILQYAWLKPILGLAAIIMKATGTYQEGYIGLKSGYFWSGIIYNLSVTMSLYSLGMFWVIMHEDLKPFRPVPKFLCVKLIIFASYWQGFFLSILVWTGALPDNVQGYTPDNLAAAIQDALICIEMPAFAVAHWYAFSWHDFADKGVSAARLPVKYAARDAFGVRDLIEDSKLTFRGNNYAYRDFDSNDKILAHEASRSRVARLRAGMRYERGGKGKYWIQSPDRTNANEADPYTPLLGGGRSGAGPSRAHPRTQDTGDVEELTLDPDMEILYSKARQLEYGDWNYPVIPAYVPSEEQRFRTTIEGSYQRVPGYFAPASPALSSGSGSGNGNGNGNGSGSGGRKSSSTEARGGPTPTTVVSKKKKKGKQKEAQKQPTPPSQEHAAGPTQERAKAGAYPPPPAPAAPAPDVPPVLLRRPLQGADGTINTSPVYKADEEEDNESLRLWRRNDDDDERAASPVKDAGAPYVLDGDEFRNVWGGGGGGSEPSGL